MKILIVRTFPSQLNTDNYNIQEIGLASALVRKKIMCDIVMFLENGKPHTEVRADGITIYWIKGFNFLKNGLFPRISKLINNYDVIQVHEYDQIQSWYIYTYLNSKNNVIIYHGPYFDDFNKGYNFKCRIFDKVFLPFSKNKMDSIPCITKSPLAADFLHKKGFENVSVAGVGLDVSPFENSDGVICHFADNMPVDKINIIYVGKLEERRNTKFLFEVFKKLAGVKNMYFTVIGSGDSNYVEKISADIRVLQGFGNFQYIEKACQSELKLVYEKADIMLFPSNYEIYGMVLMEAMYFGVVCVSTMNGGSSCLITDKEDGIILKNLNTDDWVMTVKSLCTGNKLDLMKRKASEKIRNHFLWDNVADAFIEIYKKIPY